VALLWKMICNWEDPMSLRHPVVSVFICLDSCKTCRSWSGHFCMSFFLFMYVSFDICAVYLQGVALQHTATHCNTLQHTATHCNTLQHTATSRLIDIHHFWRICCVPAGRSVATHYNTLQKYCNTLQHTTTHCSNILQHTATYCNILQHTATH